MGRLVNDEQEIISKNIDNYLDASTSEYSKYLNGVPTFTTYYHKNVNASHQDVGLEQVQEVIGSESPIRYDKIDDLSLYGISQADLQYVVDENYGVESEVEGDAIVLPDTIKPLPDDFFLVNYNDTDLLFRVTNVNIDKMNGKKYYKIDFVLSTYDVALIEEQIEGNYTQFFENIGTEKNTIVENKDGLIIQYIDKLLDSLTTNYLEDYMNKKIDILTYTFNDKILYNEFLIEFITDNNVMSENNNVFSQYVIDSIFETNDRNFNNMYDKTIYSALELNNTDDLVPNNLVATEITNVNTVFYYDINTYYFLQHTITENEEEIVIPYSMDLVDNIKNNTTYTDVELYFIENILVNHFNDSLVIDEEFLDTINNHDFSIGLSNFLLIPALMFVLQLYKKKLL